MKHKQTDLSTSPILPSARQGHLLHSWKMQGPKQDFHESPRLLHLHSWEAVKLAATPLFSSGHGVGFYQWKKPTYRLLSSAFLKLRTKGQSYFPDSDVTGLQPKCIHMHRPDLHKILRQILKTTQHWLQSSFSADKGIWDVLFFAPTPLLIHKDTLTRRWHHRSCGRILKGRTVLFLGWSLSPLHDIQATLAGFRPYWVPQYLLGIMNHLPLGPPAQ